MEKLLNVMGERELKENLELIGEAVDATNQYMHGQNLVPEVYHKAMTGECLALLVGPGFGVCVCTREQGYLYVNMLYLVAGAPKELLQDVGRNLQGLAKELGLHEVRFKTQRSAGMKKALAGIGFHPRCVEFVAYVED